MLLCPLLALALAQAPARDFVAEMVPDGVRFLDVGDRHELTVLHVGPLRDLLRHGNTVYVAPATGGLWAIDAQNPGAPVVTARLLSQSVVARIGHRGEGFLVLDLADRSVVAFSLTDPLHPVEAAYDLGPAQTAVGTGRVLAVQDGYAAIEGGANVGFHEGMHAKISAHRGLSSGEQLAEQEGLTPIGIVAAVVLLEDVGETRSLARLGRGDAVQVGDLVEGTDLGTTGSLAVPKRIPYTWRFDAALRPFVNLGGPPAAVGVLADLMVQYDFANLPLQIQAGVEPLGLVAFGNAQHNPTVAVLDIGYEGTYLALGLGAGFSVLASGCAALEPCSGGEEFDAIFPVLTGRLGSIDGLNLIGSYAIAWTHNGFDFGRMVELTANIPVARRLTLYAEGGGGTGYGYGDVGMRVYVKGLGGPGTVIVSGGFGGAAITDSPTETLGGVALSFGLELRL